MINENKFDLDPSRFMIITYDVLFDPRLNEFQKLLFAAITGLEKGKYGYCSAGNEYFCEMFNKSQPQVSAAITKLEKLGFIKREMVYKTGSKEIAFRKLTTVMDRKIYDGIKENLSTGGKENLSVIDNNIINNFTISKDIDETEVSSNIEEDKELKNNNINENIDDDALVKNDQCSQTPAAPRKGLAPLIEIVRERYDEKKDPELVTDLIAYLKAHLGCRRLPSEEKWKRMLDDLELYSSITLPGASGNKFMKSRALEIIQKAITGKDGAPFLEFDNIYNVQKPNVMEPQFNLNQEFKKGY